MKAKITIEYDDFIINELQKAIGIKTPEELKSYFLGMVHLWECENQDYEDNIKFSVEVTDL